MSVACRPNPNYCEGNPGPNNCDLMWDAADEGCTSNAQCSGATPVCDVSGTKTCVQCTTDDTNACTGTTPVCGADHTCQACTMHSQCTASNVCLPDGSCSDGMNVAYVASTGSGSACTKAMPCGTLAAALATNKPIIKIAAGVVKDPNATTSIDGKAVTIFADPGAQLDRDGDGPILEVKSANADVKIYDLEITGASGTAGANGIDLVPNGGSPKLTLTRVKVTLNQGTGISATGGNLTVTQSNISGNTGGGVSISSAQFDITNSVIAKNGSVSSTFGGVLLNGTNTGTRRLEFNTITANGGSSGNVTGVTCVLVNQPVTFSNNIVYANQVSGAGTQVGGGGMCSFAYSDIGPDPSSGTGNINADPKFVNANQGDYHLMASSPCKDVADPAATLDVDIDGDARPQGSRRDMGADEQK